MWHPLNSAGFAGWRAARTPVRQWAGWPSPERKAPAVAGSRSACTGTARHSGSPGTSHGLRARTDHTSHSFPASGHPAALRPSSRADVGGEPTDPAHAFSGRFGMVAVFGDFVESYQGIHARHVRPARPWPASAARRNLPAAATDFRLADRSRGGAASAGRAMPRGKVAVRTAHAARTACRLG